MQTSGSEDKDCKENSDSTQYSLDCINLELNSIESEEEGEMELHDNTSLEKSNISDEDSNKLDISCV